MAISYDILNSSTIDTFGVDASYTPEGQDPVTLRGVMDYEYFQTEGEVGIQARQAFFTFETSDAPSIKTGETIAASGKTFIIRQVRPDGVGVTELDLEEQP
jgi:hypothetical protein